MRYSLRTLVIVMLLAGPLLAYGLRTYQSWQAARDLLEAERKALRDLLAERDVYIVDRDTVVKEKDRLSRVLYSE